MDDQRTSRASWGSVILHAARVLSATMLVFGTFGAVAATNYLHDDSGKGHLNPNWSAVTVCSVMTLAGLAALVLIEPRIRRKN